MTLEEFVNRNWPPDVSSDCSNLIDDVDCTERNDNTFCKSCQTFETLCSLHFANQVAERKKLMTKTLASHSPQGLRLRIASLVEEYNEVVKPTPQEASECLAAQLMGKNPGLTETMNLLQLTDATVQLRQEKAELNKLSKKFDSIKD